MERNENYDELLRRKISETLGEPIDGSMNADDLMFDLGMRYLRLVTAEKKNMEQIRANQLSLWADGAASKEALVSYVESVTDENSPDYIPPVDRIAVFDLDGTLFCETDPVWFDFMMFKHRVTEDEDYKDRATEYDRTVADAVQSIIDTGVVPDGIETEIGHGIARTFAGMTVSDFLLYVRKRAEEPSPCFSGMKVGEAFYKPMVQVISYLQDNGFTVYICSGSDRLVVRGLVEGGLILASRYVIGTEELISAKNQGGKTGTEYVYTSGDELVLSGKIAAKNLKMTKVSMIAQQIGQCPVLCFGNSTGDISVANYVTGNGRYRAAAFFLCCDDGVRENGSEEKVRKIQDLCAENGWIPISMKNDWLTVFGEDVTKKDHFTQDGGIIGE